jgi:hypothetical protein
MRCAMAGMPVVCLSLVLFPSPLRAACNYLQCLGQCALPSASTVACAPRRAYCDTQCTPPISYGAIAYGPSNGSYGYSDNHANRAQVEARAASECGKNDCVIATWFSGHCGALATGSNGTWRGEQDADEQRARSLAQARCTEQGGTYCAVVVSHCSR